MTSTPDSLVREFLSRLIAKNIDSAAELVSADFEYDNVPMGKSFGPDGLRSTLGPFFGMCTGVDWEILRQTSSGDLAHGTVLNERDDRVEIHGEWRSLPVAGVFEIRDARIVLWRDYFDGPTIVKVMTPPA